jgi:hypothetical protein
MSDLDDFLAATLARQVKAEEALPHGDPGPHTYRREDGRWKIAHRHGDLLSVDQGPPAEPPTG